MHHIWKHNLDGDNLYHTREADTTFHRYHHTGSTRRHYRYTPTNDPPRSLPPQSYPVSVSYKGQNFDVNREDMSAPPSIPPVLIPESIFDLIAVQHPSHQELLQDIDISITDIELLTLLSTSAPILLASDGGAVPGRGSFGWVVQVGDRIIARGKGPAYGPDPRSFRAEGYGMASGLSFLLILKQYYKMACPPSRGTKLICNNEGLLIRIEKTLAWSYLQPNVTLRAEWDIESVILETY
jgi:hypothetical protein